MDGTQYEPVIGLETHVQLSTASKMFCGCSAAYSGAAPNTHVCPVCLGAPGVLPVINERAVRFTLMSGLALHCQVNTSSRFDRKNYPYPDLVKGYQISQYAQPLCTGGYLDVTVDGQQRRIHLTRIHLEEDTAKHSNAMSINGAAVSLIDVNRSGVPLMEVVSEPDIRSPEEARLYLQQLRLVLTSIGVTTGNLEEGAFRIDVNVSVRPKGATELGSKVEVKNLNSFRAVVHALEHEIARQNVALTRGERLPQETRGWQDDRGVTVAQRTKEYAHDYRYFPEPDLPPLKISTGLLDELRHSLPELPDHREHRLIESLSLTPYEASVIAAAPPLARYFDQLVGTGSNAKRAASFVLNDLLGLLNARGESIASSRVTPDRLHELLDLVDAGVVSNSGARQVLAAMAESDTSPRQIIDQEGLAQVSDTGALDAHITQAIDANPKALADYLGGKQAAFNSFFGPVMKSTRGQANPALVRELLTAALEARRK